MPSSPWEKGDSASVPNGLSRIALGSNTIQAMTTIMMVSTSKDKESARFCFNDAFLLNAAKKPDSVNTPIAISTDMTSANGAQEILNMK